MSKRLYICLLLAVTCLVALGEQPSAVLDRAIAAMKRAGNVTANYAVSSSQGNTHGTIAMNGTKFRLLSGDVKCWYDGKTQWVYSPAVGEVNIVTPTPEDLQTTNPMAAARGFKTHFNIERAAKQATGAATIVLTPKSKSNIKTVTLTINNKTSLLERAVFTMTDRSVTTITITGYKTGVNLPASTFKFDRKLVPAGTPVVDLR